MTRRRSFGRIRQERSGRYSAAYIGPDGRLHSAGRTFSIKEDAEGWLSGVRRSIELDNWGTLESSDGVTLRAYADRWLKQRQLRPRTIGLYEGLLKRLILPELGEMRLATITPATIRGWHAGLDADKATQRAHAYGLLHAIFATAVADELIDANPCRIRAAMQTKRRRDVEVLTPAQVDKLASKMPGELRASVTMAAWCGLRWGETSELRRKDLPADCSVLRIRRAVTYRAGVFTVGEPKTSAGIRDVAVPPHIRPIIKEHLRTHVGRGANALLFPGPDGGNLRPDQYRYWWELARKAIKKPNLRVHDLRHVGAVLAAQSGATTAELMHRLGHTTPEMALRYQHVAEGRDAEIAARLSKLAGH